MSEKETELLKDTLLSYVSRSAIGQAAAKVLFQEIATLRAENLRLSGVLKAICDVDETCGGIVDLDAPVEQSEYLQGLMQNAREFLSSRENPSGIDYTEALTGRKIEASKQEGEK